MFGAEGLPRPPKLALLYKAGPECFTALRHFTKFPTVILPVLWLSFIPAGREGLPKGWKLIYSYFQPHHYLLHNTENSRHWSNSTTFLVNV